MLLRFLLACALPAMTVFAQTGAAPPLNAGDAAKLEKELQSSPDDVSIRVQLIRHYGLRSVKEGKQLRAKHVLWMIEHQPDNSILSDANAAIEAGDRDNHAAADAAWRKQLAKPKLAGEALANAVSFFSLSDPAYARKVAEEGLKTYPGNEQLAEAKGRLLAYEIFGVKSANGMGEGTAFADVPANSEEEASARRELETTSSAPEVGGAASIAVHQLYPLTSQSSPAKLKDAQELAVQWSRRAVELDPKSPARKSGLMTALQYMAMHRSSPGEKIDLLEQAAAMAPDAKERGYMLTQLAPQYLMAGDTAKASDAATELLKGADDKSDWNYGNAISIGNLVLGRIALKQGNVEEAKTRLLAAGKTPGSPQLNSFGPDWNLPAELLAKGESDTVVQYLKLCGAFWKLDRGRLNAWIAEIHKGGTPKFDGTVEIARSKLLGTTAPEFRLKDLKGAEVSLSDFKGKAVLLDFWATWCHPCRDEMPEFQRLHAESAGKDVAIVTIDSDEPLETVARYVGKEKFTFPVLLGKGSDVVARYSITAFPTTFAIDKNGRIADMAVGGGSGNGPRLEGLIVKARAGAPEVAAPDGVTPKAPFAAVAPAVTADDFYRDGYRLREARDFDGAIKAFNRALELGKEWPPEKQAQFYYDRGQANSNSRKFTGAAADFTRAIVLNADFPAAYNNRGLAYIEMGQLDEALKDLDRSLVLNPANGPALHNRARVYMTRKEYAKAIADYDAALRMNPNDEAARSGRSSAQRLMAGGALPAAPRLLSPEDGAVLDQYPRHTTVVWSEVPGAVEYAVEWDYKSAGEWNLDQRGMPGATIHTNQPVATFDFVGAQPGRWRVWAINAAGDAGPKSEWREFRYTK
jgi:tetratricopeptide (TPR) repeat protein/peroxiredoxin